VKYGCIGFVGFDAICGTKVVEIFGVLRVKYCTHYPLKGMMIGLYTGN
jgi:hypothetical protein